LPTSNEYKVLKTEQLNSSALAGNKPLESSDWKKKLKHIPYREIKINVPYIPG
jgi:hypothetical protein